MRSNRFIYWIIAGSLLCVLPLLNVKNVSAQNIRNQKPLPITQIPKSHPNNAQSNALMFKPRAYDISQWQGDLTQNQADRLRSEVNFMILRAQAGSYSKDSEINHNEILMRRAHIPYGTYSYSYYENPAQASNEAYLLKKRSSSRSHFYINDCEENDAGTNGNLDNSTRQWAVEMHRLTRKPVILYSDLAFMNEHFSPATLKAYDALWIADYSNEPDPNYHYDLWQESSTHYSEALNQQVDTDTFPQGHVKSLGFWEGYRKHRKHYRHYRHHRVNYHQAHIKLTRHPSSSRRSRQRLNHHFKTLVTKYRKAYNFAKYNHSQVQVYRKDNQILQQELGNVAFQLEFVLKTAHVHISRHEERLLKFYQVPFQYYRSPHIHILHVIRRHGIELYNYHTHHKVIHIKRGTRITHIHLDYIKYHHHYITRAVGLYHHHYYAFTTNKDCVRWYP